MVTLFLFVSTLGMVQLVQNCFCKESLRCRTSLNHTQSPCLNHPSLSYVLVPIEIETSSYPARSQSGCFCPRWGMPDGCWWGDKGSLWADRSLHGTSLNIIELHIGLKRIPSGFRGFVSEVHWSNYHVKLARSVGVFPGIPSLSPAEVVCFLHVWQGSIHFPWIRHWPTSRWFGADYVNDSGCCYKLVSRYFVVNKGDNGNSGKSLLKGSPNTAVIKQ